MQQAVLEEDHTPILSSPSNVSPTSPYEPSSSQAGGPPPACSYDDLFPALPESTSAHTFNTQQHHAKMRVGSSVVTQVFRVPFEERKFDNSDKFGESETYPCLSIMLGTGAHIEMSLSKDGSLTFLVTGKQSDVLEARRKILTQFQTQASKQVVIPKEYHRWIIGKNGERLQNLEKQTATKINVPSVGDSSDIITITGTREGIEKAEHDIQVWSNEQSKKALERIQIPKIYHPFICGPSNDNLNALMKETGTKIYVPPVSSEKTEIVIVGEKDGVLIAKSQVEKIYKEMEKKCTTVSVEVPKSQHKYVCGSKGSTIAEILKETGVSVEMPASDNSTGTITLRGPQEKLGLALNKVYEKANSVITTTIEAPAWIHKYIIGRKGANIKKITQDFPKVHVEFTDNRIKIEGPPEEINKAQVELETVTKDLVSTFTFVELTVDPKYCKHIIGKSGANVNRLKEETGVMINIDDTNRIRIEGTREGVAEAQRELEEMVVKLQNEKEKDVIIDQRHYRAIIGTKGETIKEIRDKFNQVQINFPGPGDKRDVVKIRGPKEDVDKCHKYLMKLVKDLNESSYHIEVPIYKQFHKFIIGKGGANIRKIRDETQTKIDLPAEGDKNDVITITGKKENVEEAHEKIMKIQNALTNFVTDEITIPPKYYNSLIGVGGKLIHSIMEDCGGVAIKFPTTESKSDKVTIRGPKEEVERAKQQLLELTNERQLSSFTAEVRAKSQQHKFLIGKNGANIKKIRDATGARIVFPTDKDEDKEIITIIGKKDAVEKAKAELEATIKEIENIIESDMSVDPKHHKHFVARRGEVLHRITEECGGVTISFPRSGVSSDRVVLKGPKEGIEAAKARIQEIVGELEVMVTIDCVIPQTHHRTIMGAKGFKVKGITSEFDVNIKFPDRELIDYSQPLEMNGDAGQDLTPRKCDIIRITGKLENCEAAKQALLDLIPVTVEADVPFELHRSIIGQKGRDVKELMDTYDVHIVLSPANEKLNVIKITGTPANVERAKEAIKERVKELEAAKEDRLLKSYELKIEVNPDYHPKIIGRRGAVITNIRTNHDVQINFPKKGDPDDNIITITGYQENAHRAKDDIMKIVNELNELVKEDVEIDSRVHRRLIGTRGRNIRKIMEDFKVDIKFPRAEDPNPNLVTITGHDEHVQDAKDHLLNLEEEYLQDVTEQEQYRTPVRNDDLDSVFSNVGGQSKEFVVKGGPWEQKAPNTASVKEFPSFGAGRHSASSEEANTAPPEFQQAPIAGAWGQRH